MLTSRRSRVPWRTDAFTLVTAILFIDRGMLVNREESEHYRVSLQVIVEVGVYGVSPERNRMQVRLHITAAPAA